MKHIKLALGIALMATLALLAAACGSLAPAASATPTTPPTLTPMPTASATSTPAPTATPQPSATPQPTPTLDSPRLLTGVNLAGADFGSPDKRPGVFGSDYTYPTHAEVDYFVGKGMNVFRLPFNWENLQPKAMSDFAPDELARLDDIAHYATGRGARVILDPHNYARYYNKVVGSDVPVAAFADFWRRLAGHFKDDPRIIFGLMNEPNTMSTELWLADANAAIAAIRQTGAANLILVPGNAWTGAHSWDESWYGTPNATVMLGVQDPASHYAYDAHQYLDDDSSGTHEQCTSADAGSQRLKDFTAWLRTNHRQAFLGEFAGARNDTCYAALDDMLTYLDRHTDVWLGWTYWAAGPWWGDYLFTLEPQNGVDRPQMAILVRHFSR